MCIHLEVPHRFRVRASCRHTFLCLSLTQTKNWSWKLLNFWEELQNISKIFFFSQTLLSDMHLGGKAGAIWWGRTVQLHFKYTSQRLLIYSDSQLYDLYYIIVLLLIIMLFFSGGQSVCTVCVMCYKWEIQAKWGLLRNILGEKSF